jgi:hypothetical protein
VPLYLTFTYHKITLGKGFLRALVLKGMKQFFGK